MPSRNYTRILLSVSDLFEKAQELDVENSLSLSNWDCQSAQLCKNVCGQSNFSVLRQDAHADAGGNFQTSNTPASPQVPGQFPAAASTTSASDYSFAELNPKGFANLPPTSLGQNTSHRPVSQGNSHDRSLREATIG